jgi:hypothetical protein
MLNRVLIIWIVYAGIMGFAVGGSFVASYQIPLSLNESSTNSEQSAPSQNAKEKSDEALARYTWWLTLFTSVLAFATIGLGIATVGLYAAGEKQFRLARDDFNATHRPWLPITNATTSFGLRWAKGNAIIGFSVFCRNTGSSPAQRISLAARIFPFLANEAVAQEIAKLQKAFPPKTASRELNEHTLFPDTSGEMSLGTVLIIPEDIIAGLKDYLGDPVTEMVPVILGFIKYHFSFGEEVPHYTPFVYHLWRTDASGDARITLKLDGSSVEAKEMILVRLLNAGDPT